MVLTHHVLHVDTIDDEVVEVYKTKADIEAPKKRAAKTAKAPTKEKVVEKDDSDDEPVIVKKAKGPARKAPAASKAPAKTKVAPAPSGTFMPRNKIVIALSDLAIVLVVVGQTTKPALKKSPPHQSRGRRLPRHAKQQYPPRRPRQSQSRNLPLHPLSLVCLARLNVRCYRTLTMTFFDFQRTKPPFMRTLPLLYPRADPNRMLRSKPALFHLWA